ncbi:uncharacterized protein LOC129322034 [Prosopis cineraria]|uniref:uncharacterized protein LOC129322034 n=1 Tax=Prosopis cineraria TaxID=364024 RepID=UPI00240EC06E|nr:uncharacterized protein LOC129322034 [Prosopis cineraria]
MDTLLKFPGTATPTNQGVQSHITTRLALRSLSFKGTCNFGPCKTKIQQHSVSFKGITHRPFWDNHRISAQDSDTGSNSSSISESPSQKVKQFYACINDKNLRQLGECISKDAQFDDYSFPQPFNGKVEVVNFLNTLTASMGQNVKFKVGHVCEGDGYSATANWHLAEWKGARIPFTRGCTVFEFSKEGEKLTIKKAVVLIESPIKPGGIVLTLLKTVTSLFDDFPKATEWFLKSHHEVLKRIKQIYNMLIAPLIVNPLLKWYIKCWSIGARLFGYTYNIAIYIYRIFFGGK